MTTTTDPTARDAEAWRLLAERLAMIEVDASDLRVYASDTEHPQAREVFGHAGVQLVKWTLRALHDALTMRAQP